MATSTAKCAGGQQVILTRRTVAKVKAPPAEPVPVKIAKTAKKSKAPAEPAPPPPKLEVGPPPMPPVPHRKPYVHTRPPGYVADKKIPPYDVSDLLDTFMVEGKTLRQWQTVVEKFEEEVRRKTPPGKLVLVDLTFLPGWVSWALEKWRASGSPTRAHIVKQQIKELREKADKQLEYAEMDEKAAKAIVEDADVDRKNKQMKAYEKKLKQAESKKQSGQKKRERYQELHAEADALEKTIRPAAA